MNMKYLTLHSKLANCEITKSEGISCDLGNSKFNVSWFIRIGDKFLNFSEIQLNEFLDYANSKRNVLSACISEEDEMIVDDDYIEDMQIDKSNLLFSIKNVDKFNDYNFPYEVVGIIENLLLTL